MQVIQGSVTVIFALAQAALAAAISLPVTAGMLLGGGMLLAGGRSLVPRSRGLGRRLTAGGRGMHATMTGFLGGLKQAKSDAAEVRHVGDFAGALAEMRRHQLAFTRVNAAAQAVFQAGGAAALAALVWLAVRHTGLSAPELLVMTLIATRVLPALQRLLQQGQQLAHALPAWLHAIEMERRPARRGRDAGRARGRTDDPAARTDGARRVHILVRLPAGRPSPASISSSRLRPRAASAAAARSTTSRPCARPIVPQ